MSLVTWAKKNSRALGKVALYATGGVLIGAPLIRFGTRIWKGEDVMYAADHSLYDSYGIAGLGSLPMDKTKLRGGIIATGLGALAIMAARKI